MAKARESSLTGETTPLLTGHNDPPSAGPSLPPGGGVNSDDLDVRFKRWLDYISRRSRKRAKATSALEQKPQFLFSLFEKQEGEEVRQASEKRWDGFLDDKDFANQLASVKAAIGHGINPRMIQTGSSGSYFIRACLTVDGHVMPASTSAETVRAAVKEKRIKTVAVFKPNDEEPYGNLNPKRVFLRRYLWWAMGRPCLIPSFSYLSEVGASLLDDRLHLSLVPSTRLVYLCSSVFSYSQSERQRGTFREKVGSYQNFLHGYVNVSTFLRAHPWPSRPRDLLERDLQAEHHAHGRARARAHKGKGAAGRSQSRGCLSFCKKLNCCALDLEEDGAEGGQMESEDGSPRGDGDGQLGGFFWTKEHMQDFRLELEKLVCFDYLMRNTDRGLDNFMVKVEQVAVCADHPSGWKLTLAAIDNSLAFPWKHPAGIRSYPWGWLYLPTDLIGGNFSPRTRQVFVPLLSSASWWNETERELERLFRQDDHFDEKKFQGQMDVLRGQAWNLLESLRSGEEGPLELCARQKQLVRQDPRVVETGELSLLPGSRLALTPAAQVIATQWRLNDEVGPTPSQPVPVKAREGKGASGEVDAIQPRSLPEAIDEEQISHRWHQASVIDGIGAQSGQAFTGPDRGKASKDARAGEAIGKAYRGKSLGIDVLTAIDKRRSKGNRPVLRKALTGHGSRGTVVGRGEARSRREVGSDGSEREDGSTLEDSVASFSGPNPSPAFLKARRRRNGSVGDNWSISSVLDRGSSIEHADEDASRVQVLVERLEADDGVAWQTWLGLQ